jgi:S-adenosylmethionine hydrolase
MKTSIITLLTDFGAKDHYIASMKGAILSINPRCTLVDITHQVKPHNVKEGAFILANAYSYFPKGTIHLAVVDPGVGGLRKPILFVTRHYFFVGPDNGLFTLAFQREKVKHAITLTNSKYFLPEVSFTFHGRDIFAPVAAHLSLGLDPRGFGNKISNWSQVFYKKPKKKGRQFLGEILHIDSFGNLISNIPKQDFFHFLKERPFRIRVGERIIQNLKKSYWEGKKRELMALFGSGGFLEISVREGNAQKRLKVKEGGPIIVQIEQ